MHSSIALPSPSSPPPPHTQSFGEPKPCLCGAPNCRKVLAGKPQKEETPAPQLTAKGQQTQREAAAAEAFRRTVVLGKPLADVSDVVLFFNGRTSRGEMARVSEVGSALALTSLKRNGRVVM